MKLKSGLMLLAFISTNTAFAAVECESLQPKEVLHLTYPQRSGLNQPVDVQFELDGDTLLAQFEVRTPTINAKQELAHGEYPYQHDVVELFLSVEGMRQGALPLPYWEFELSPYNQTFEVRVDDMKKPFVDGVDMKIEHQATRTATGWKGELAIPLKNLNWDGDPTKIVGNAFSVLGKVPARSYWSLSLPPEVKANFHKPQFFKPLLKCR